MAITLFEYVDKREKLLTSEERERLLHQIPSVIADTCQIEENTEGKKGWFCCIPSICHLIHSIQANYVNLTWSDWFAYIHIILSWWWMNISASVSLNAMGSYSMEAYLFEKLSCPLGLWRTFFIVKNIISYFLYICKKFNVALLLNVLCYYWIPCWFCVFHCLQNLLNKLSHAKKVTKKLWNT